MSGPTEPQPRLYADLAEWWPLLSPPSHYLEEAADLLPRLLAATDPPPRTLLELGCGGGSLAWHLKAKLQLTLSDRSPQMLAVSRRVNPECEHVLGDMRSLRLGQEFDLVFIHDAIMSATELSAVQAALETAYVHCRRGGAVVVVPDCVRETFEPKTTTGGEDAADGRGMRYLEWIWDPVPTDSTFEATFAFLLRDASGIVRAESDRHIFGLFARDEWRSVLQGAGFTPNSWIDRWRRDVFAGVKSAR